MVALATPPRNLSGAPAGIKDADAQGSGDAPPCHNGWSSLDGLPPAAIVSVAVGIAAAFTSEGSLTEDGDSLYTQRAYFDEPPPLEDIPSMEGEFDHVERIRLLTTHRLIKCEQQAEAEADKHAIAHHFDGSSGVNDVIHRGVTAGPHREFGLSVGSNEENCSRCFTLPTAQDSSFEDA